MHIESFEVHGFLNRREPLSISFNEDINIVTGFNGAGKTNLLKLIWYTVSGNIHQLLKEVSFSFFTLTTSDYSVHIAKRSENTCLGWFELDDDKTDIEDIYDDESGGLVIDARDQFSEHLKNQGGSLFFPTFRRIEGGFTISGDEKPQRGSSSLFNVLGRSNSSDLQKAVIDVSQRLTNNSHNFVTSISTVDISDLLLRRYSELSETSTQFQSKMTQEIISEIRTFRAQQASTQVSPTDESGSVLDQIAQKIEKIDAKRDTIMSPFKAVQDLVGKIFRHKAIQVNKRVSFGDAAEAISSDLLSAGEKQMLSFICYNAFFRKVPIFIDEPELSLHVDWQRTLFPTLESQKTSNQFIIATHSPFIYSKYPEKEIALASARGDEEDNA